MRVQASPFVTRKHHIPDPCDDGEGYCWVSVILPPEARNGTHSDEAIMLFVARKCKDGQTALTHQPLHGLGDHCISLPVKWNTPRQNLRTVRDQAAALGSWWLVQIRENRVTIDQEILFDDRTMGGFKNMLDVIPPDRFECVVLNNILCLQACLLQTEPSFVCYLLSATIEQCLDSFSRVYI
ncbi:hypothetical protein ACN38_g10619 [Penicillium nordicum]|uniref:Uncharacterized protein n=1 Tax=Penicillium nordicum TaxID=229535 RepID=A0A0M9WBI1_9EURO|nr:hypothetical protein ACN38_g10619 [Penicillium nordicum]